MSNNKSWGYPCAVDVQQASLKVCVTSPSAAAAAAVCAHIAVVQQQPAAGCVYIQPLGVFALWLRRRRERVVRAALSVFSGREGVKHGTHLGSAADPATHLAQEPVRMPAC